MVRLFAVVALLVSFGSASVRAEGATPSLDMKNMHVPMEGLMTGGQPSVDDLAKLKAAGYTTIVNLRMPDEVTRSTDPAKAAKLNFPEAGRALQLGFTYVNIPVAGPASLTRANAELLDGVLKAAEGPVLIHCASGNRAGALLALRAYYANHQSKAAALEFGRKAGMTRLEPAVGAVMDSVK